MRIDMSHYNRRTSPKWPVRYQGGVGSVMRRGAFVAWCFSYVVLFLCGVFLMWCFSGVVFFWWRIFVGVSARIFFTVSDSRHIGCTRVQQSMPPND